MTHIVFIHLFNDFSGSPIVLHETIKAAKSQGLHTTLYIGSDGDGILSSTNIYQKKYWYRRTSYKILTLLTYTLSQFILFFRLINDNEIPKNAIIYVNTLLPYGAALYGKLTKRKVIYHIHEVSITPKPLKWFLTYICRKTSSFNIYVSNTHQKSLPIPEIPSQKIYNTLKADFIESTKKIIYQHKSEGVFHILMIASLRDYKGIPELFKLAKNLSSHSDIQLTLVVNDDQTSIDAYCKNKEYPANLSIYPRVSDTSPFYQKANLVLNLSRVDQWEETFGMTILEAITYGIPCIVPPIGGPAEIINNGIEGFHIDSRDHQELFEKVLLIYNDDNLVYKLSKNARKRSTAFTPENFSHEICSIITQLSKVIQPNEI